MLLHDSFVGMHAVLNFVHVHNLFCAPGPTYIMHTKALKKLLRRLLHTWLDAWSYDKTLGRLHILGDTIFFLQNRYSNDCTGHTIATGPAQGQRYIVNHINPRLSCIMCYILHPIGPCCYQ